VRSLASSVTTWPVFNVTLEGKGPADHLVVAEGIVTGDLSVQNEIAADRVAANAPLD
jgi:hypothetical protein